MGAHSRNKGSAFEREVARELFLLTGVTFKRDLDQVREVALGDLVPDDPAFPFLVECKRYAEGTGCRDAWRAQAAIAAAKAGKRPAVVFRFDRQETRVALPLTAIWAASGREIASDEWATVSLTAFATVAAELMNLNSDPACGESRRDRSSRLGRVTSPTAMEHCHQEQQHGAEHHQGE